MDGTAHLLFSPTSLWPADRSWFVWTDDDLQGTKVSGEPALVEALKSDLVLECVDWPGTP